MIWLSWRQHRIEMLVLGVGLSLIATYLIYNGLIISAGYHQVVQGMSAASCVAQQNTSSLCQTLQAKFFDTYEDPNFDLLLPLIVPALIGVFLGAPLVARELERGTFRMIWTQSVTQLCWLLVKMGAQLAITVIAFAIISQLVTWYIVQNGSFGGSGWDNFDVVGIVPLAYMTFALALGIAAGAILRNTVAAMLATLITFPLVRILIEVLARPHYLPPLSMVWDPYLGSPPIMLPGLQMYQRPPGQPSWTLFTLSGSQSLTLFTSYVDRAGHIPAGSGLGTCIPTFPSSGVRYIDITACAHAHGLLYKIVWQPADRMWLFQGIESVIFLGLAAGLLVLTYWWICERIS